MRTNATCLIDKQYRKTAVGALPRCVVAIGMNASFLPLVLELYAIKSPSQVATSSRSWHGTLFGERLPELCKFAEIHGTSSKAMLRVSPNLAG